MKKILFVLFLMIVLAGVVTAEDTMWGSMYEEWNLSLGADAAIETGNSGVYAALYPAVEMLLFKPLTGDLAFLDLGAAVKGRVGVPLSPGSSLTAGLGVLGTFHLGFRGFDFPAAEYLDKIDLFAEVGVKFDILRDGTEFLGLTVNSGANYFLTDNMAVGLHYSQWGSFSGGGVSVFLKLGDKPAVKGFEADWEAGEKELKGLAVQPYLLQFYSIFYAANFAGGFYPGSYNPGEGTIHEVTTTENGEYSEFKVEKGLLKAFDNGDLLWNLKWYDDEEEIYYEFITDADFVTRTVYYMEDNEVIALSAGDDSVVNPEGEYLTWEDYSDVSQRDVRVEVEAGSFQTTEHSYTDDSGTQLKWWHSETVPGSLVSYLLQDETGVVTAELIEITKGRKPRLYK